MFQRFQNLMSQAVEMVVPEEKTKKDTLVDHWNYVASYFDGSREMAYHIDETNISFHLVSIIKYIKEEEVEQEETQQGLTGPCLEELLHRKMPDQLVDWALLDKPKGMLLQVLRSFSLLVSNVNHRLLPEATVRLPLERLIIASHQITENEDIIKIKCELMKLVNVLFRRFKLNQALINLFIIEPRNDGSPVKGELRPIEGIPLFECCNDYISSGDFETARIARESMEIMLNLIFSDSRLTHYLMAKNPVFEGWVNTLVDWYNMLPVRSVRMVDPNGNPNPIIKSGRSVSPLRSSKMEAVIPLFFDLWTFCNSILAISVQHSAAGQFRIDATSYLLKNLISKSILPNLKTQDSTDKIVAHYEYVAEMIPKIKTADVLHGLVEIMISHSEHDESSTSDLLARRLISKNEDISIASLRLVNAFLATYDYQIYQSLVLVDLSNGDEDNVTGQKDHHKIIEELMWLGVAKMDVSLINNDDPPTPSAGFDGYFVDAQERYQIIMPMIKEWPFENMDEKLDISLNFLDIILMHLSRFFYNSPQKNLLITQILTSIASAPISPITQWFFDRRLNTNNITSVNEEQQPLSAVEDQKYFCDVMFQLREDAEKFAKEIPEFHSKYQLIRRYCGDDMLMILHNLSSSDCAKSLEDMETILAEANSTEKKMDSLANLAVTMNDNNEVPPPLSVFLPAYIILSEFCKEIAATLLVVDRNADLKARIVKMKEF